MLAAQVGLKTPANAVADADRPELLRSMPGKVLEVREPVFEMRSVLAALATQLHDCLVRIDGTEGLAFTSRAGRIDEVVLREGDQACAIRPSRVVLAAGAGNAGLRSRLGLSADHMQRRPLHMCMVKGDLPEFHGHCVDGSRTRVTITSTSRGDTSEEVIWQLGGQLAENGVNQSPDELIRTARTELSAVLPALDQAGLAWSTYRVDRAERAHRGRRPDDVAILEDGDGHTLTCWPTKMALAPRLADIVLSRVPVSDARTPSATLAAALADFDRPELADYPWETATTWTAPSDAPA